MKAVIYEQYGPPEVLQLKEVNKPKPGADEVLIKVEATAVNSGDWRLRKAEPFAVRLFFGLWKPRKNILGGVLSGVVEKVGSNVTRFKEGDSVFGSTGLHFGAYAAYTVLPENSVLDIKPGEITYLEAASIPFGALTALHFLKQGGVSSRKKLLVNGASGAVGSAAVQLAKYFNAEVTGVCSTANLELVKNLGADRVIDYTREDFTRNGEKYDVIIDTVDKLPFKGSLRSLNKNGRLVLVAAGLSKMLRGTCSSLFGTKKVISGVMSETVDDLAFLKQLIQQGNLRPVVDKTYLLEDIAEAHRYVEGGHKKGNVGILVTNNG